MAYCQMREQRMEDVLVQEKRKRGRPKRIRSMCEPAAAALPERMHVVWSNNEEGQTRKRQKQQEQEPRSLRERGQAEVAVRVPSRFCEVVNLDWIVFKNRSLLQGAIEEFGFIQFLMLVERWYSQQEQYYSYPAVDSRAWVAAWEQLKPVQPRDIVMGFSMDEDIPSATVKAPAMFWEALLRLGIRAFLDLVDLWGRRHNPNAAEQNRIKEANIARSGRTYGMAHANSLIILDRLQEESDVDYCRSGWMVTTKHYERGARQRYYHSPQGQVLCAKTQIRKFLHQQAKKRIQGMESRF